MSKYCNQREDVPKEDHFAIIEFSSIYIEGDERSRTCPGHGYPARNEPVSKYIAFTDQEEWANEVGRRTKRDDKNFVALRVKMAVVDMQVTVKVE